MKRKFFSVVLGLLIILVGVVGAVQAGRAEHSYGAIFMDHTFVGFGMTDSSGLCYAFWNLNTDPDVNDFIRLNPDSTYMSKVNEADVTIYYREFGGPEYWGTGKFNRNFHGDFEGGVFMNVRGFVSDGTETKYAHCMSAFDDDLFEQTWKKSLR